MENPQNESQSPKPLIGEATPEQIAAWKKEHGEVTGIKVDGHICYLRNLDRKTLGFTQGLPAIKANEIILKACWLGGSEKMQTDDGLFLNLQRELHSIVEHKEVEVVKL